MAFLLCGRFLLVSSCSFSLHPFQLLSHPTPSSPNYPINFTKITNLSLLHRKQLRSSSSMEAAPEGYRRNVGICLINPSKKIFAASRLDVPDSWQMPQGGIDGNEVPRDAAIRELREETGVTSAEVLAEVPHWLTYDFPPNVRESLNHRWGADWKGQAQKWFLLKFNGKEEEVNLLGDGTEKPEFGEWSWLSPEEVIDRAVDFKKPVYKEVMAAFSPYLH
ncbi:nudix hydrolase 26, chloroplastic [Rhododendron vialii]|uniref:nudix hydrolase 26, chloroplastic n=1 Tax=Rhododendron vialii TaxID=182163 RepID=UPI00265FE2BE|nr:nudix hydrolase 26, chloroplastic [Rhododendron vialii]